MGQGGLVLPCFFVKENPVTQLVKIQYVGNKKTAFDNVARTGLTWEGFGDIKEVREDQARTLLKFSDQWILIDEDDRARIDATESIKVVDEDGDTVVIDPDAFKKPIEKMTKAEIIAYAANKFGKDIDVNKSKKMLIDIVEEFERDLDITVGVGPRAD